MNACNVYIFYIRIQFWLGASSSRIWSSLHDRNYTISIEGTARFAGFLLAPVETFGFWPRLFLLPSGEVILFYLGKNKSTVDIQTYGLPRIIVPQTQTQLTHNSNSIINLIMGEFSRIKSAHAWKVHSWFIFTNVLNWIIK